MNPSRSAIFSDILDEIADGEDGYVNLCLGFLTKFG